MPIGVYKHKKLNKWSRKYEKCVICGTVKTKHDARGMCKDCYQRCFERKEYFKKFRQSSSYKAKRKILEQTPEHKLKRKIYYQLPKVKEKVREYQQTLKFKEKRKAYVCSLKGRNKINNRRNERSKTDIHFKLRSRISTAIYLRLKNRLSSKNGKSSWNFLPYTVEDLISHLEKQFEQWMNWDNYGKWHIDHIKPDSRFNYKSVEDKEFQDCWALSNLRPLEAIENLKKSNLNL